MELKGKNQWTRVLRALARQGLDVSYDGAVYSIRGCRAPVEVLLPETLPLEPKALAQIRTLADAHHPGGGCVCKASAMPDFHPGDEGIPIGSVVETEGLVIPQAVGSDINCGMRLHVMDLDLERFQAGRDELVKRLTGDYLLGTRDVVHTVGQWRGLLHAGLPGWLEALQGQGALGFLTDARLAQLGAETASVWSGGHCEGASSWMPDNVLPTGGDPSDPLRESDLGTIGRGNHFVEFQVVEEIYDRHHAFALGVRPGMVTMMLHSGSRGFGRHVGAYWRERTRTQWPADVPFPEGGIFPLLQGDVELERYVESHDTAMNYGFVNRAILAELGRRRLRQVFGEEHEIPLVVDVPHNLMTRDGNRFRFRKGASVAHEGQAVVVPGSMGDSSYLAVGRGSDRFLDTCSHGAGRAKRRGAMGRLSKEELGLTGVDCITLREERRVQEAPAAYKSIEDVMGSQVAAGTLTKVARMRPLLTFKA